KPGPQQWLRRDVAPALEQEAPAVAAAQKRHRRWCRAQHRDPRTGRCSAGEVARKAVETLAVAARKDERCQPTEGRHASHLALGQWWGDQPMRVAREECLTYRRARIVGREQTRPGRQPPPAAPRDLMQQLVGSLCGAQPPAAEAEISVDDSDQSEHGKMVTLG